MMRLAQQMHREADAAGDQHAKPKHAGTVDLGVRSRSRSIAAISDCLV
jgi:hypothetical protein